MMMSGGGSISDYFRVWLEWVDLIKKIRRGIPLTVKAQHSDDQIKMPIYTLYSTEEGK